MRQQRQHTSTYVGIRQQKEPRWHGLWHEQLHLLPHTAVEDILLSNSTAVCRSSVASEQGHVYKSVCVSRTWQRWIRARTCTLHAPVPLCSYTPVTSSLRPRAGTLVSGSLTNDALVGKAAQRLAGEPAQKSLASDSVSHHAVSKATSKASRKEQRGIETWLEELFLKKRGAAAPLQHATAHRLTTPPLPDVSEEGCGSAGGAAFV
jgi:hypothetical protein